MGAVMYKMKLKQLERHFPSKQGKVAVVTTETATQVLQRAFTPKVIHVLALLVHNIGIEYAWGVGLGSWMSLYDAWIPFVNNMYLLASVWCCYCAFCVAATFISPKRRTKAARAIEIKSISWHGYRSVVVWRAKEEVRVGDRPYGMCCPWVRGGWGLEDGAWILSENSCTVALGRED